MPPKMPPALVEVYEVKPEHAVYYDNYPASVTALNQVDIRPEVSGYLTGINFKDGQHVNKGVKLYGIDQQQYKAAYEQAVANLNAVKANLIRAQQDADRYNDLAKKDAIARQVLEHAQADLQSAKMQVAAAESNVNAVQTNLRNSVIYAAYDGTIGISQVKLGSAVTAGQTLLNTLSSDNPVAVDFGLDEKLITKFINLLQVKAGPKDSTFTLILPDQTVYPYSGHLSFLDRAVDPQTGTIKARIIFPNNNYLLRPGLTCNVRVLNNNTSNSIIIPYKAVSEQMGEYFVFVAKGNKAIQTKVTLGVPINEMVIVKDGLTPGEFVITEGVQKLRDNSPIILAPAHPKQVTQAAPGK
ncbi:MAG: efflux RND transporter periplasmic adaptor subunit [Ignavibacteriaceae bacterium]|nr:efflux RND transporter periplasmic adaptor subunit [Ignavibacteriaceae bacterium]